MFVCLYFSAHDHLIKLHFVTAPHKIILWKMIEDILSQALTACLVNIQSYCKDDPNALLYFCINQANLNGGIRSAVHVLKDNPVSAMVKQFMLDFYRFVNSNAEMKLDNTFEVFFHVASGKLTNRPVHRRKAIPVRAMVGSRVEASKVLLHGSLINLPLGSPQDPGLFQNCCLLVTFMFSLIKVFKPDIYASVRNLTLVKSSVVKKNTAATLLLKEITSFCDLQNIPFRGPHELQSTMKLFGDYYGVQLVVITAMASTKPEFISYPEQLNENLQRFYFLLQSTEGETCHILAVQNLTTFFKSQSRGICFYCRSYYFIRGGKRNCHRHRCRSEKSCSKCFGFKVLEKPTLNATEPWSFCYSLPELNGPVETCSKCGVTFESHQCFNNHKKFCDLNNYYWLCPVCNRTVSMRNRPPEVVMSSHKCDTDTKFCSVCLKIMPVSHICAVSKQAKTKAWPNIGVVSLFFQDALGELCQTCHDNHRTYAVAQGLSYRDVFHSKLYHELLCDQHKNAKSSHPNIVKVFYEKDRYAFQGATFSDDNFLECLTPLVEEVNFTYSSTYVPKTNFSGKKRRSSPNNFKCSNSKGATNQFLKFLSGSGISNCVFLVQTNAEMLYLLNLFVTNFWQPDVVQSGREVKKISLSHIDVSFLLFQNYCKGNLFNLNLQFDLKRPLLYFPMIYNQPKFYNTSISVPPFVDFLSFSDTDLEITSKLEHYRTLPDVFNVNEQLWLTISENLKTFLLSVTKFLQLSFEIQDLIITLTSYRGPPQIHPFDKQIVSLSSFTMAIYKFYYQDKYEVHSVLRPYTGFYSKVSAPEYEYLSYLSYSMPNEDIVHAFNRRDGQQRFSPSAIVDGYGRASKTVYQFHGCIVSIYLYIAASK